MVNIPFHRERYHHQTLFELKLHLLWLLDASIAYSSRFCGLFRGYFRAPPELGVARARIMGLEI